MRGLGVEGVHNQNGFLDSVRTSCEATATHRPSCWTVDGIPRLALVVRKWFRRFVVLSLVQASPCVVCGG